MDTEKKDFCIVKFLQYKSVRYVSLGKLINHCSVHNVYFEQKNINLSNVLHCYHILHTNNLKALEIDSNRVIRENEYENWMFSPKVFHSHANRNLEL